MAYGWREEAEGAGQSDKLSPGYHRVRGAKVVMGKGSGLFKSKKGDPQIMLVVENEDGQEGTQMFTLSDKASWTLARWLSRCGVDLSAMEAEGVEPKHFTNEEIAKQYLVGKECWVLVEEDGQYLRLTPVKEEEVDLARRPSPGGAPSTTAPTPGGSVDPALNLDDIPF